MEMVISTTPDFEARESEFAYEEWNKVENNFFTWRAGSQPGTPNHPFAQIALHVSGELFAYYNTLMFK